VSRDRSGDMGAYREDTSGVVEWIVDSPENSVFICFFVSSMGPRSRYFQSRLLPRFSDRTLEKQSCWATLNYSCALLPSELSPIELSMTELSALRKQDIISLIRAWTVRKRLLLECPKISRSLCNSVSTIKLPISNKKSKKAQEIIVESDKLQTTDIYERDYPRALYVNLGLEPSYGLGLTPGEELLMNWLRNFRSSSAGLSVIENEIQ